MHYLRIKSQYCEVFFSKMAYEIFQSNSNLLLNLFPIPNNICDKKLLRNRRENEAHDRTCHLHLRI